MMMKKKIILTLLLSTLALSACSSFGPGESNLPKASKLKSFANAQPINLLWKQRVARQENTIHAPLYPTVIGNDIYVPSYHGVISVLQFKDKSGLFPKPLLIREIHTHEYLTTSLTPGLPGSNLLFITTEEPALYAISAETGELAWEAKLSAVAFAAPAVAANAVIIKTEDGHVAAFDSATGTLKWSYQTPNPSLEVFTDASAPVINGPNVYIGFSNGNLVSLSVESGAVTAQLPSDQVDWLNPFQQKTSVVATPLLLGQNLFTGYFHGEIIALNTATFTPNMNWNNGQDISILKPLTSNGSTTLFAVSAEDSVYGIDTQTGKITWDQDNLRYRDLSAPTYFDNGNQGLLAIGDREGAVQVLSAKNGEFVTRTFTDKSGISAPPLVVDGEILVYTNNGWLYAFKMS